MTKSQRQLKLLIHLQSNRYWTVEDVAKSFDVSRRTIFRDLTELKEMNIPIDYEPRKGFKLLHGYKIPPLMFTTKELAVIAISLSFMKSQPIKTMVDDADNVSSKINDAIPGDLKDYLNALEKSVIVDPYAHQIAKTIHDTDWHLISDAIAFKKCIRFKYKASDEIRELSPYLVVYFEDHWNIIGFDHKRKAIRNFRLSALRSVEISSDLTYVSTQTTDPLELIYDSANVKHPIICEINKPIADQFLAKVPARFSSENRGDRLHIKFEFDNLEYLAKWFLQYGKDCQIIAPQKLIEIHKKELNQMLSSYLNL